MRLTLVREGEPSLKKNPREEKLKLDWPSEKKPREENENDEEKNKISNMKPEHVKEYSDLIKTSEPDFIHVKGFKSLGYSRKRLSYEKQPFHEEVREFAEKLLGELKDGYKILGEENRSCIVLIGKDKDKMKIKESEI